MIIRATQSFLEGGVNGFDLGSFVRLVCIIVLSLSHIVITIAMIKDDWLGYNLWQVLLVSGTVGAISVGLYSMLCLQVLPPRLAGLRAHFTAETRVLMTSLLAIR